MGLFLQKEICGMKLETRMRLFYESYGKRMAIDLTGVEKNLALKRVITMTPPSTLKGFRP